MPRGTRVNPDTLQPTVESTANEPEPDFSGEAGLDTSSIEVTEGPTRTASSGEAAGDDMTGDDVYFAPVDPPLREGMTNSRDGLVAGFEPDSMTSKEVDGSTLPGTGDEALADAVRRELLQDSATAGLRVEVEVEAGVAYLRGRVADLDDVENAEEVAGRIPGVREVVEELQVSS